MGKKIDLIIFLLLVLSTSLYSQISSPVELVEPFMVNPIEGPGFAQQDYPKAVPLSNSRWALFWKDERSYSLCSKVVDGDGQPVSELISNNSERIGSSYDVCSDGDKNITLGYIAYGDDSLEYHLMFLNDKLEVISNEMVDVEPKTDDVLPYYFSVSLDINSIGKGIYCWEVLNDTGAVVYVQRFESTGELIDNPVMVNDRKVSTYPLLNPFVKISEEGTFIVSYPSLIDGMSKWIFQAFNESNIPLSVSWVLQSPEYSYTDMVKSFFTSEEEVAVFYQNRSWFGGKDSIRVCSYAIDSGEKKGDDLRITETTSVRHWIFDIKDNPDSSIYLIGLADINRLVAYNIDFSLMENTMLFEKDFDDLQYVSITGNKDSDNMMLWSYYNNYIENIGGLIISIDDTLSLPMQDILEEKGASNQEIKAVSSLNDTVLAVWYDQSYEDEGFKGTFLKSDGTIISQISITYIENFSYFSEIELLLLPNMEFLIVWRSSISSYIFKIAHYDKNGNLIQTYNVLPESQQFSNVILKQLDAHTFMALYSIYNSHELRAVMFSKDGEILEPFTENVIMTADSYSFDCISISESILITAYQWKTNGWIVHCRWFDKNGQALTDSFKIKNNEDSNINYDIYLTDLGNKAGILFGSRYDDNSENLFWATVSEKDTVNTAPILLYSDEYRFNYTLVKQEESTGSILWESSDVVLGCTVDNNGNLSDEDWILSQSQSIDYRTSAFACYDGKLIPFWNSYGSPSMTLSDVWCSVLDLSNLVDIQENVRTSIPLTEKMVYNYPNPFNSSTTLIYNIAAPGHVQIKLYNIIGQEVMIVKEGYESAGEKRIHINLNNLSSGVYFVKMSTQKNLYTKKIVLLR